jgi:hypothetical protein
MQEACGFSTFNNSDLVGHRERLEFRKILGEVDMPSQSALEERQQNIEHLEAVVDFDASAFVDGIKVLEANGFAHAKYSLLGLLAFLLE